MSDHIQPTSSQNPQNTAVESQSVGQFKDWDVVNKENVCFKGLSRKVSGGFSLGRSIGRVWRAVKEGVSAFFQKLFGKKSKVPTVPAGVEMDKVTNESTQSSSVSVKKVPSKSVVSRENLPQSTVPQTPASQKEKEQSVSTGLPQLASAPSNPLNTSESNTPELLKKTASKTSSTQSTASVKKDAVSSSPKYRLVDVPGDGSCGVWAVLAGMRAINLSECERPKHGDYGGRPIATQKQKQIMVTLRKRAEREALKAMHTNPSAVGSAARLGLRDKSPTLETVDFHYIAQAIGRPIVVSQYQGNVEVYRTICDPKETEPTSLFREDFNNQQLRQGNPIRLYFDGGHYQLMQPIKTS